MPLRPSVRLAWDGIVRPRWTIGTLLRTLLKNGMPHFENSSAVRGVPIFSSAAVREFGSRDTLSWAHVDQIRRMWSGKLVLKGILSAEDARIAADRGVDGVIVSSHGGRQLDASIAPLHALPAIVRAKGAMKVMIDSGIRRGNDVLKAIALGADFVFIGRPFIYAAAIGGQAGVAHAIRLLSHEIQQDMALIGVSSLRELGPHSLARSQRLKSRSLDAGLHSRSTSARTDRASGCRRGRRIACTSSRPLRSRTRSPPAALCAPRAQGQTRRAMCRRPPGCRLPSPLATARLKCACRRTTSRPPRRASLRRRRCGLRTTSAVHAAGSPVCKLCSIDCDKKRMRRESRGLAHLLRISGIAVEHTRLARHCSGIEQPLRTCRPARVGQHRIGIGHALDRQPRCIGRIPLRLHGDDQSLAARIDQDRRDLGAKAGKTQQRRNVDAFMLQKRDDLVAGFVVTDAAPVDLRDLRAAAPPRRRWRPCRRRSRRSRSR